MGNNNSNTNKQIIDPNKNFEKQNTSTISKIILEEIKNKTNQITTNDFINKNQFNEILIIFENMNIIRLRDTPIGKKIFEFLNINFGKNSGIIPLNCFYDEIEKILSDKNSRKYYLFKFFDADNNNKITREEFIKYFEECYINCINLLNKELEKSELNKQYNINYPDLCNYINENINKIKDFAHNEFIKYDINKKGFMVFDEFNTWRENCTLDTMHAQAGDIEVIIPVTLGLLEFK